MAPSKDIVIRNGHRVPVLDPERSSSLSMSDWLEMALYAQEHGFLRTTMGQLNEEQVAGSMSGVTRSNGPVFSLLMARLQVFSQARFQWTRFEHGEPGELFGSGDLSILERPWPGATTANLLARLELDASHAGNSFTRRLRRPARLGGDRLVRLRPDWTHIILGSEEDEDHPSEAADVELLGYAYMPSGDRGDRAVFLRPDEVAHYAPIPDPDATYLGMSWMTPVIRDVMGDNLQTDHKRAFLRNAATPNLGIKFDPSVSIDSVRKFKELFEAEHKGAINAYKCLHPDTDVAMWDGRRVPARDVAEGDLVVAWAGDRAVPGTVSAAEWQPASPIVTIRTQRGRVIRTNDRHPFLVRDEWVDAADLAVGDLLTTGLGWSDDSAASEITEHEAWLLGALTGDGCMVSSTPVVSAWDDGVRARLGERHELRWTGKGHDYRMFGVTKLARLAGLTGKRSWEKRIPDQVMTGPSRIRTAFLAGLIDTDGHVADPASRRSMELGITSVSRELLADAQHLLASLGVNTSLSCAMPAARGDRDRDAWRLCAFGNAQARQLAELLDLACESKRTRLATYADTVPMNSRDMSRFDRVVAVETGDPEPTIGIEVAEFHTHVTGGVVTHNTLFLGGGADMVPLGHSFKEIEFAVTQGKAESRMASAAGVPPSWVGFSEGLQGSSLNTGNFTAARRRFGDGTMQHLWMEAASSLETILDRPDEGASLWFVTRGVPFLHMDAKDAAEVRQLEASTIVALVRDGFTPKSAIDAVKNNDWGRLEHTGLTSVQMQPPGTVAGGGDDGGLPGGNGQ